MSAPPLSLLILEDDPAHFEAIRRAFETADPGVEIRLAASLRDYCDQVADRPPDIVLMDLNLPDGDAQESLNLLSESNPFPVLIMTSTGNEEVSVAAMKAGAIDYVVKSPQMFANLPRSVQRVLREWNLLQERKRTEALLRASEERFALALEAVNDALWDWNISAGTAYFSPKCYTMLGYEVGEFPATYESWRTLVHPEDLGRIEGELQRDIESGKGYSDDIRMKSKSGEWIWISTRGNVVEWDAQGKAVRLVGIHSDISERKAMESKLSAALDRAESATRAKSEFLAMMTHELRTPLNGLMGFSELLSDTPLNDEQREYAQTINSSGEHLLSIINDILDFSSIENGRLYLHSAPFSIAGILESSMLSVRKSAIEKGLDLHSETGSGVAELIAGDERRVRQILINLLGNAVKFTSTGSVVLRVAASTTGNRPAVDFSVEDTGLGISAEALGRLFQPFTQASSAIGRSFGGTGLGLSISRRLAEAMNGTITVTSTLGKGSIFTLRLPLEVSFPAPSIPGPAVPVHSEPKAPAGDLILVVEDDKASGVIAVKMLQNLGHHVEFVTNGAEAIEAFSPGKYSAILMDVAMPLMDGLVATEKIREIEAATGFHVPIIAFTAQAMMGERERCLAAGMDEFLAKPFKKAELAAKIASISKGSLPQ